MSFDMRKQTKLQTLAEWYYKQLVKDKRKDGTEFYKFESVNKEDEKRCHDIAYVAHNKGDVLPDDFRYDMIHEVLSAIWENEDPDEIQLESDIYTHDLTSWLNSRTDRYAYCDEYVAEFGLDPKNDNFTIALLQGGQYLEKQEVLQAVLAYLRDEIDAETESEE